MGYFLRAGIVICLICCVAWSSASLLGQTQEPPADPSPKPQITSADAVRLVKVCSAKNPPPCATHPIPVFSPEPDYSSQARQAKLEGTCTLMIVVSADGRATNIRVVHALGMGLDEKAIDAVKRWKFKPAMQDGKPVAVQMAVEVAFRLYQGGMH